MSTYAYLHYAAMAAEATTIEHFKVPVREWAEQAARQFTPADYALSGLERAEFIARLVDLANEYLPGMGAPDAA